MYTQLLSNLVFIYAQQDMHRSLLSIIWCLLISDACCFIVVVVLLGGLKHVRGGKTARRPEILFDCILFIYIFLVQFSRFESAK